MTTFTIIILAVFILTLAIYRYTLSIWQNIRVWNPRYFVNPFCSPSLAYKKMGKQMMEDYISGFKKLGIATKSASQAMDKFGVVLQKTLNKETNDQKETGTTRNKNDR